MCYKVSCRQTVAGPILNRLHDDISANDINHIGLESVLIIDGWKNKNNNSKHIATLLQTSDDTLTFLESFDVTDIRETAENLQDICEQSIQIAKTRYNTIVFAVVSDNAANMISMGNRTTLYHSTCNSHTGNLLAKDLVDPNISSRVISVLKECKRSDLEKQVLEKGGQRCQLPGETRWSSYRNAYLSFKNNYAVFKQIIGEDTQNSLKIKQNVINDCINQALHASVEAEITLTSGVCTLINKVLWKIGLQKCGKWTNVLAYGRTRT